MTQVLLRGLLLAVMLVPLIFIPQLYDIYDLSKASYLRMIAVLFVALWILDALLRSKLELPRNKLLAPVAVFIAITVIATFFSLNPIVSSVGALKRHEGWTTFLAYGLLFFGAASCFRRKDQHIVSGLFASVVILVSSYGILQRYGFDFMDFGTVNSYDLTRAFATTGNPVFLGTLLALAVPFFAVMTLQPKLGHPKRLLYGAATALGTVACLFTYSRGAWLGLLVAFVVGIPLLARLFGWKPLFERWKSVLAVAGLVALMISVTSVLSPQSSQFTSSIKDRAAAALNTSEGSAGTRIEMWKSTLRLIEDRPVLGIGLENFKSVFPFYRSLRLIQLEGELAMPDRPHNELLYVASSLGLVGLASFLWLFIAAAALMIRWARRQNRNSPDASSPWMLAAIAVAILSNFVAESTSFTTINTTAMLWLLMGFAVTLNTSRRGRLSLEVPRPRVAVIMPLYVTLILSTGLFVQYVARFPVADYYYNEARFARAFGQLDRARSLGESAIRMNPYQNLYRLELAGIFTDLRGQTGDLSWRARAVDVYQDAVFFDRYDEDSWANMGNAYVDLAQNQNTAYLKNAEAAFTKSLEIDPYFSVAHVQLGTIHLANGKHAAAIRELRAALEVSGDSIDALMPLAEAYLKSGNNAEAIKTYNRVLVLDPKHKDAREALKLLSGKKEAT